MHRVLSLVLLFAMCGCSTSESHKNWTAAEILAGRQGAPPLPQLPDCPYTFPPISEQRREAVADMVQQEIGLPVLIEGPYTAEILSWISEHGRLRDGQGSVSRIDYLNHTTKEELIGKKNEGAEIFFYSWDTTDEHAAQFGYVLIRGDSIVHLVTLLQT